MDAIVNLSREHIQKGSRSFAKAATLFPKDVRDSAYMLYAWCRHCDDAIDGQYLGFQSKPLAIGQQSQRLQELRHQTLKALAGAAEDPIFIGLQRVVTRHSIPHHLPLDLIEGMGMDVRGHFYAEIDDTLSYSYHVAGTVGLMMAMIMGVQDRVTLARASDLGIAFQLTNIVRDIVADTQIGRVYLPASWLAEQGLTPQNLADAGNRVALFAVAGRILNLADHYYASALDGVGHLPFRSACAVAAARRIYRGIGTVVRTKGAAAWDTRASTSKSSMAVAIALAGCEAALAIKVRRWRAPSPRAGLWTPASLTSREAATGNPSQ